MKKILYFVSFCALFITLFNLLNDNEPYDSFFLHTPEQVFLAWEHDDPITAEELTAIFKDFDEGEMNPSDRPEGLYHFDPCCSELASLCKNQVPINQLKKGELYLQKFSMTEAQELGYVYCSLCWPSEFSPLTGESVR